MAICCLLSHQHSGCNVDILTLKVSELTTVLIKAHRHSKQSIPYPLSFFSHLIADRCSPVPEVANAIPDSVLTTDGMTIYYTCMMGHIFNHNEDTFSATCNNGVWVYNQSIHCIRKLI